MANTNFLTLPQRKSIALIASVPTETGSRVVKWYVHATTLAAATLLVANYFDGNQLNVNDVIFVMCAADGVGDALTLKISAVTDTVNFTGITAVVNTDAVGA
jgi:hypothetical protein